MSDYIKRDAVVYQLEKQATIDGQPRAIRRAAKIVAEFPAADVVEIEPGAWILTDYDGNTMKIKGIQRERIEEENKVERKKCEWIPLFPILCDRPYCYECSNCGFSTERRTNFCSCCGADMQRKEADT